MPQFPNIYRPTKFGRRKMLPQFLESAIIGTGGVDVGASTVTAYTITSPRVRGWVEAISVRATVAAASSGGVVTAIVYKRNVAGSANVALTAAFSLEAAGITALQSAINVPVLTTLTVAERTKLESDTFFLIVTSDAAIQTQPTQAQFTLELSETR